ncbi:AMED_5909 family protein [Amycolatopsis sp. DSM 110486]|uniref:AMED_5909 family protein n=1 Tax=Amycolatopsis sp. DSM 110486 TaxID=2865832 RepID=UPI002102351D|nr:AMED_5909 family protein [Amycolatopsis sp. DSM 110486]
MTAEQYAAKDSAAGPTTLYGAHQWAQSRYPPPDAPPSTVIAFHQENKRMYERIADMDRGHHHEALYFVGYEQRMVDAAREETLRGGKIPAGQEAPPASR